MYGGALAGEKHPVAALAEGEVVRHLRKIGVGLKALDRGFYLLNVGRGEGFSIRLNIYRGLGSVMWLRAI
jgi:hypothetical protein